MAVKPIPDGYHSVTPYLIVHNGAELLEFYKKAFGAVELMRMVRPDGRIGHAEIRIGDSPIMMTDECQETEGWRGPHTLGASTASLMVYVEDVDAAFARAVAAGAKIKLPLQDQFYGDRSGTVVDPSGHTWTLATHKEDLTPEEMYRRAGAASQGG